jgi:hypothetical protein
MRISESRSRFSGSTGIVCCSSAATGIFMKLGLAWDIVVTVGRDGELGGGNVLPTEREQFKCLSIRLYML